MKKTFVMRGQTASTSGLNTEVLNFGVKDGYAYRLVEFQLYPSTNIGGQSSELCATITAGKTGIVPTDPNFNDEALIATYVVDHNSGSNYGPEYLSVINDTFLITQNLILMVMDTGGSATPVNWQCRFESVKMTETELANANLRQFHVYDG